MGLINQLATQKPKLNPNAYNSGGARVTLQTYSMIHQRFRVNQETHKTKKMESFYLGFVKVGLKLLQVVSETGHK